MLSIIAACVIAQQEPNFLEWGLETVELVKKELKLPDSDLYGEEAEGTYPPDKPAFMWPCGVWVSALNAAAKLKPAHKPELNAYTEALRKYWTNQNGIGGFDVLPNPTGSDRYYDDNAWMVLALIEAYEVTSDFKYLGWAESTMKFVLSGEDSRAGGGIYWHELKRTSKNTCSNAPTATAALKLYLLTKKPEYLEAGKRLLGWLDKTLFDGEKKLYSDHITLEGGLDKTKWSYNTALVIRAKVLLHDALKDTDPNAARASLDFADILARSAVDEWVGENGAIRDDAAFAHLFAESLLFLHERNRNENYPKIVRAALIHLRTKNRDGRGHYPKRWGVEVEKEISPFRLIDQASAARAYLIAARFRLR